LDNSFLPFRFFLGTATVSLFTFTFAFALFFAAIAIVTAAIATTWFGFSILSHSIYIY
jgi:hypothetical protein